MNVAEVADLLLEGPRIILVDDVASPISQPNTNPGSSTALSRDAGEQSDGDGEQPDGADKKPKIDKKIAVFLNRVILRLFSVPSVMAFLKDVVLFQDDQAANGQCKIQLVFHRLPDEAHPQIVKLIAAPRDPKFSRFVDQGQARTGVEMEVQPDDFGGEDYDYAF